MCHGAADFARLGVAARGLLGEHPLAVKVDFEHATAGRHEGQLGDLVAVLGQQLGCQTGSALAIPSDVAVLDADVHLASSVNVVILP